MNRTALALIFAASIILPASSAPAIIIMVGQLQGSQEVPANLSPGFGDVRITVDNALDTMRVQADFANLIGNTTAVHVHCCAPAGTNVGVATMLPFFTAFPIGVTSGTYDFTFDMTLAASYNPSFVTAQGGIANAFSALTNGMATGNAYFNIHTVSFPGGELRAQLQAVPEPSTWAMLLLGFGAIGMVLRRSRRLAGVTV